MSTRYSVHYESGYIVHCSRPVRLTCSRDVCIHRPYEVAMIWFSHQSVAAVPLRPSTPLHAPPRPTTPHHAPFILHSPRTLLYGLFSDPCPDSVQSPTLRMRMLINLMAPPLLLLPFTFSSVSIAIE